MEDRSGAEVGVSPPVIMLWWRLRARAHGTADSVEGTPIVNSDSSRITCATRAQPCA